MLAASPIALHPAGSVMVLKAFRIEIWSSFKSDIVTQRLDGSCYRKTLILYIRYLFFCFDKVKQITHVEGNLPYTF